jgi:NTP pyrophosphatase (non-canonical NTP hydrolase)
MDFESVSARINEVNSANGFDLPIWDNLPMKVMLTVTELDEAYDAVKGAGKDPLGEELADVSIRLLSILEAIWPGMLLEHEEWFASNPVPIMTEIASDLWLICSPLCKAVEAWRHEDQQKTLQCILNAIVATYDVAEAYNVNLDDEIEAKIEKNSKRPKLHGKARSDG